MYSSFDAEKNWVGIKQEKNCKDSLKEEKVDRKYKSVDPEYVSIQMKAIQQYFQWYFVSYCKRLF